MTDFWKQILFDLALLFVLVGCLVGASLFLLELMKAGIR